MSDRFIAGAHFLQPFFNQNFSNLILKKKKHCKKLILCFTYKI